MNSGISHRKAQIDDGNKVCRMEREWLASWWVRCRLGWCLNNKGKSRRGKGWLLDWGLEGGGHGEKGRWVVAVWV
ncbi:hypothetical protein PRUPE_2G176800 [Prunus persica]|uniref:Uncharacterized protein n=1 Tax=Prunus persica TaxID=3760 RepID=M5X8B9_PRUPE|nr:hypothetical protein PRUPE_2G176800 [Prunus persica]